MEVGVTRQSLAAPVLSSIAWRLLEARPRLKSRPGSISNATLIKGACSAIWRRMSSTCPATASTRSICIDPVPRTELSSIEFGLATDHRCIGVRSVPAPGLDARKESCDRRPQPAAEKRRALLTRDRLDGRAMLGVSIDGVGDDRVTGGQADRGAPRDGGEDAGGDFGRVRLGRQAIGGGAGRTAPCG